MKSIHLKNEGHMGDKLGVCEIHKGKNKCDVAKEGTRKQ